MLIGTLILIIVILAIGLAYYYGKSGSVSPIAEGKPVPTKAEIGQVVTTPQPTQASAKKVRGGGILSFPHYELTIPADWENSREVTGPDSEKVILKKGMYELSIMEGGFGGAACLYPGDADMEGPSGRYKYFVDIKTKSGDLLRRSWSDGKGFSVCQKTQYGWGAPTLFGHMSIVVPDTYTTQMVEEIDGILASITKI